MRVFQLGTVEYNEGSGRLRPADDGGKVTLLTRKEQLLLEALLRAEGRTLTYDHLLDDIGTSETLWVGGPKLIQTLVSNLRAKIEAAGADRNLIENLAGRGYRFRVEDSGPSHKARGHGTEPDNSQALRVYLSWLSNRMRLDADSRLPLWQSRASFGQILQQVRLRTETRGYIAALDRQAPSGPVKSHDDDERSPSLYRHPADGDDDDETVPQTLPWTLLRGRLRRAVILGDPGMGKSWLLYHEALLRIHEAQRQLDNADDSAFLSIPIPVILPLASLQLRNERDDLIDAVVRVLAEDRELVRRLGDLRDSFFDGLEDRLRGYGVLLLDAFDEVQPLPRRDLLRKVLNRLLTDSSTHCRFLLTSRSVAYDHALAMKHSAEERELELVPFGPGQIQKFITAWFGESGQDAAWRVRVALRESGELAAMATIPILLTLLCATVASGRAIPSKRTELYSHTLHDILRGTWRDRQNDSVNEERAILREVAWQYAVHHNGWQDYFSEADLLPRIRQSYTRRGITPDTERVLARWTERNSILIRAAPEAAPEVPYLFLHQTFHEYLVAEHVNNALSPSQRVSTIAKYWDAPNWSDVWSLYIELCDGDDVKLTELFETILENGEPTLDPILCRPQFTCLRIVGSSRRAQDAILQRLGPWLRTSLTIAIRGDEQPDAVLGAHVPSGVWQYERRAMTVAARITPEVSEALISHIGRRTTDSYNDWGRVEAINVLAGRVDDENIRQILVDRLNDEIQLGDRLSDRLVRFSLIVALTDAANDETVMKALLSCLHSDHQDAVEAAIEALSRVAGNQTLQALLIGLLNDGRAKVSAARVLAGSWDEGARTILLQHLRHNDPYVRTAVVTALEAEVWEPPIQAALLDRLQHDDHEDARWAAMSALKIAADDETVANAILSQLEDSSYNLMFRDEIITALAGAARFDAVKNTLIDLLDSPDEENPEPEYRDGVTYYYSRVNVGSAMRAAAAGALGLASSDRRVQEALIERLRYDNDAVAEMAARSLAITASDANVRVFLIDRLRRYGWPVRVAIAESLTGVVSDNQVRAALVDRLYDDSSAVRAAAVRTLSGGVNDSKVRTAILERLHDDSSVVRAAAAESLGGVAGDTHVRKALVALLRRSPKPDYEKTFEYEDVRLAVVESLAAAVGHLDVRDELVGLLGSDGNRLVRRAIAVALRAATYDSRLRDALVERLKDEDWPVRDAAVSSLAKIARYLRSKSTGN